MQPSPSATSAPQRQVSWRAGSVISGRYRLKQPIGAGAMGEVWRAEHVSLGTTVAVKLVDTANRDDSEELLARFHQEARAAAQLKSPHVVQILDHGSDASVAFIAMECLEGESLEQRLTRRGKLLPSEVAHILREMARGIDRAHAAGIVHRDLKPPNVFLARVDGIDVVKVLDFGIAKFLGAPKSAHLQTQAGFVVGTPAYMSPEQVLGKQVDHRADLWQMAVIAYECTTGKRPFDGQTLGQLFMAICSHPMPVPSQHGQVPPGFDAWFARAAHRDPAQRFGTAGEMVEALFSILAPGGIGESAIVTIAGKNSLPEDLPTTGRVAAWSTGRVEPAGRRNLPVTFIAGLALAPISILVAGGLWWLATRRAEQPVSLSTAASAVTATATTAATAPPIPTVTATASASAPASSASAKPGASSKPSAAGKRPPPPPPGNGRKQPVDLGI